MRIFSAHNNKISEIFRCLNYSLGVLYGKLYGTKLYIFLHIICESALGIRHIGLENLKNYSRSFSSSHSQKRCAPGDIAPLNGFSHILLPVVFFSLLLLFILTQTSQITVYKLASCAVFQCCLFGHAKFLTC